MGCRAAKQYLREQAVRFDITEHPTVFTAQRIAASEHIPGRTVAKVVMVHADGELVMLVLPATSMVDLSKVAALLGVEEVRLAREPEFAPTFPDCEPGAMPPFGELYGVVVYADRAVGRGGEFVFQAGTHDLTMTIPYSDYERLVRPKVGDISVAI